MKINFDATKPIYEQIIDQIKKMLIRQEMSPGEKLPSQRDLARLIEVNPNTIQRAYREMELLELVETRRGKGTFIKEDEKMMSEIRREMARDAANKFIEEMLSLGFSQTEIVTWIENELVGLKKHTN